MIFLTLQNTSVQEIHVRQKMGTKLDHLTDINQASHCQRSEYNIKNIKIRSKKSKRNSK